MTRAPPGPKTDAPAPACDRERTSLPILLPERGRAATRSPSSENRRGTRTQAWRWSFLKTRCAEMETDRQNGNASRMTPVLSALLVDHLLERRKVVAAQLFVFEQVLKQEQRIAAKHPVDKRAQ